MSTFKACADRIKKLKYLDDTVEVADQGIIIIEEFISSFPEEKQQDLIKIKNEVNIFIQTNNTPDDIINSLKFVLQERYSEYSIEYLLVKLYEIFIETWKIVCAKNQLKPLADRLSKNE